MVIPLLGVKTRCADKSTAEHYEHTYIHMADRQVLLQRWLDNNKTWLVKLWFGIPSWYVLSENEEKKLFNYIVEFADDRENSYIARSLDCSTICDERFCYFCGEVEPLCRKYTDTRKD